jgi:hypothetical protein
MSVYRVGGNKSSQNVFPSVRPTLDLDFANSKTLDPRITFTRASGGSYVGADGLIKYAGVNEARFDHDPSTGESLGLLIEEGRTNQVTDSIVLSNMPEKTNITVVDNAIISPDGTQNASKIIETSVNGTHDLSRLNVSTLSNVTYTISGYFKAGERKNVRISFRNIGLWGEFPRAVFNLEGSGNILSALGNIVAISIINTGNGWYRCSITSTRDSSGTNNSGVSINILDDNGNPSYQGLEGYGIYAWGLQFERGTFASSFIPTLGTTATRTSDTAELLGNNFSSWFNRNEGSIRMSYKPLFNGSYQSPFTPLFGISDGVTSARSMGFTGNNNTFQLYFVGSSGSLSTTILPNFTWLSPPIPSSQRKEVLSFSYTADFIRAFTNRNTFFSTSPTYGSGKPIPDLFKTQVKPTSVNYIKLSFGGEPSFTGRFNCHIQNFRYYPKELGVEAVKNLSDRNR